MDGKVFNLSRLRSINLTTITSLCAFEYADDNSVASHTEAGLQATLETFNFAYTKLGLNINLRKTQVLHQPCPNYANPQPPAIVLQGQTLENVEHFCYLGSPLSSKADIDVEIQHRLQGAGTAFGAGWLVVNFLPRHRHSLQIITNCTPDGARKVKASGRF
ncbi:hypothetical protein Pmani_004803 [Petrolisthes manimaculis]|uniref:Reverse transcriptase domain-containing protein n=1 Tax=Petrolisthes manimaculis TaxID=1843537 RepID=A0AAE1QG22_9EUCA|nr:hypothetical protein Pmani_004803 [Petrolisthes manimaculis]